MPVVQFCLSRDLVMNFSVTALAGKDGSRVGLLGQRACTAITLSTKTWSALLSTAAS